MKKLIIITGKPASGKTMKALKIAHQYSKDEVVFISCGRMDLWNGDWLFTHCSDSTKLVIVEEIYNVNRLYEFINFCRKEIVVNKKGEYPYTINPILVLVCQLEMSDEIIKELTKLTVEVEHHNCLVTQ